MWFYTKNDPIQIIIIDVIDDIRGQAVKILY